LGVEGLRKVGGKKEKGSGDTTAEIKKPSDQGGPTIGKERYFPTWE